VFRHTIWKDDRRVDAVGMTLGAKAGWRHAGAVVNRRTSRKLLYRSAAPPGTGRAIGDRPMSEEEWAQERADVLDDGQGERPEGRCEAQPCGRG
jgi:hypothetical protein